jgi:UV DNA damage endonuclease
MAGHAGCCLPRVVRLNLPELGLVCLSSDGQCRYRAITRARFLSLGPTQRPAELRRIYWQNLRHLDWTLGYCHRRGIKLYRISSNIFPLSDYATGQKVLESMAANLAGVGRRAKRLGIRLVIHPDQFCVLNAERRKVCRTSTIILEKHGLAFDLMGLSRTPWNLMNIHGGKAGRADELVAAIEQLPESVRGRLTLENDEYSYSAADILDVCQRAKVPMVFDCHHHVIKEELDDYAHESVTEYTRLAAETWPHPDMALYHVSNGDAAFRDRYHSQFITMMPPAYRHIPWLEVEARGKEQAIAALRNEWPQATGPADDFPLRKPTAAEKRAAEAAVEV